MTNASPNTAEPLVAPPLRSARRRFRILAALVGLYLFLVFASPILTDEAGLLLLRSGWWSDVGQYWLYGCVILVSGWIALGKGRLVMRVLQGLIGIGWLLLAWLLGQTITPNWKYELEVRTLACAAVAASTFAILIAIRFFSGKVLLHSDGSIDKGTRRFQYSLTTLLFVMPLIGLTITLLGWIDPLFWKIAAQSRFWYSAGARTALEWDAWGAALGPLLIAAACLPAFLSNRPRAIAWILGLFAMALVVLLVKNEALRRYISFSLDERNAVYEHYINYHLIPGMVNLATVSVCLFSAAAAMRFLGYRIQAKDPHPGPLPRGE